MGSGKNEITYEVFDMIKLLLRKSFSGLRNLQGLLRSYIFMAKCNWFMKGVSFKSRLMCGKNVYISCTDGGTISFGVNVYLGQNVKIISQGNIRVGDNAFIGDGSLIVAKESIFIGDNALIAEYVVIRDQDHNFINDPINLAGFNANPIVIEHNVWIASKATVLKGVHIGAGSIVAAHALVNKPVLTRTIVAGIPAKQVSSR